jgi:hypothetical protein
MASQKRFSLVFVLIPLVAVLGIIGVVGWNMYREYAKGEAEEEETRRVAKLDEDDRLKAARAKAQPQKVEPLPPDDELGNLPKVQPKKPVKAAAATSPAQKAYYGFKSAYDKLEATNENAARKFRVRKLQLDDQFGNGAPANEAKFVAECDAVRSLILEALRNPENQ